MVLFNFFANNIGVPIIRSKEIRCIHILIIQMHTAAHEIVVPTTLKERTMCMQVQ